MNKEECNRLNISNIKVGDTFKNYKVLCEALGEKTKTGNAKKSQINEWERYFLYSKQGNKFIINEIYDKPKPKNDLRSEGNNVSIYMEDIENLILDLLGQERNKGKLFLSRNMLLKELKMINENYTYYRNRKIDLSKFMNIHIEEINDFYESSNSTFKSNLETALNRLQRQSLIYWSYALTVCYIDTSAPTTETGRIKAVKRTYTNDKGETVTTYDTVKPVQELAYRKATDEEIRIIIEIEKDLLEEYKCKNKSDLYKQGKLEEYYNRVKEILFDRTNIIFYYNSFEILFNDRHIQERLEEIQLEELEKWQRQNYLNFHVINKLNENAGTRHEKAKDDCLLYGFDFEAIPSKLKQRANNNYTDNNYKLSDTLINKEQIELIES